MDCSLQSLKALLNTKFFCHIDAAERTSDEGVLSDRGGEFEEDLQESAKGEILCPLLTPAHLLQFPTSG